MSPSFGQPALSVAFPLTSHLLPKDEDEHGKPSKDHVVHLPSSQHSFPLLPSKTMRLRTSDLWLKGKGKPSGRYLGSISQTISKFSGSQTSFCFSTTCRASNSRELRSQEVCNPLLLSQLCPTANCPPPETPATSKSQYGTPVQTIQVMGECSISAAAVLWMLTNMRGPVCVHTSSRAPLMLIKGL